LNPITDKTLQLSYNNKWNKSKFVSRSFPAVILMLYSIVVVENTIIGWIQFFSFLILGGFTVYSAIKYYHDQMKLKPDRIKMLEIFVAVALITSGINSYNPDPGFQFSLVIMMLGAILVFYHIMLKPKEINPRIEIGENSVVISLTSDNELEFDIEKISEINFYDSILTVSMENGLDTKINFLRFTHMDKIEGFLMKHIR
jgi:hypothetical protein